MNYKKTVFFKTNIILFFTLLIFNYQSVSGKYEDAFTVDIYEQDAILTQLAPRLLNETQVNEELIKHFLQKKEKALEKHCFERLRKKIEILRKDYDSALQRELWESAICSIDKVFAGAGGGIGLAVGGPVGLAVGQTLGGVFSIPFTLLGESQLNNYFPKQQASVVYKTIRDLELEIYDLQEGLKTEPIKDLEFEYIKKKRNIEEKKLKSEIEKGLIEARKTDYLTGITTQFLDLALKLPTTTSYLLDVVQPGQSLVKVIEKFNQDPFFTNFSDKIKSQLLDIITLTVGDSVSLQGSKVTTRKTYYFYGDPSAGKTSAAKEIPKFLGLPYFEMSIRSIAELNQESLEGSERIRQNVNVGWLVKPFLEITICGTRSFKNAFLIINDLDRVLSGMDPKSSQIALSFLLDYLDPEKKNFYSPYFRSNIDISHLNIIITANKKMEDNYFFEALKTRIFKHIAFPKFSHSKMAVILNEYLKNLVIHRYVPQEFMLTYLNPMELRVEYNRKLTDTYGISGDTFESLTSALSSYLSLSQLSFILLTGVPPQQKSRITVRELEHRLDDTVNHFVTDLKQKGINWLKEAKQTTSNNQNEMLDLYTKAALSTGLGEVCYEVGKRVPDRTKALLWYKKGAATEHKESMYECGLSETDPVIALKLIEKAALLGNDEAINWVCNYYETKAETKDYETKAETKEETRTVALNNILLLLQKQPQCKRIIKAVHVLGDKFAYNMPLRFEKAEECYSIAIDHGYQKAIESLYKLAEKVERSNGLGDRTAKTYYRKAANKLHPMAQFKLGYLAWRDNDFPTSLNYFKLSEKQGNKYAESFLGLCCLNGFGTLSDRAEAIRYWTLASNQGEYFAKINLIRCDKNIDPFTKRAILNSVCVYLNPLLKQLKKSDEKNETAVSLREAFKVSGIEDAFFGIDLECYNTIGVMISEGIGTESNIRESKIWFRRANKLGNKREMFKKNALENIKEIFSWSSP